MFLTVHTSVAALIGEQTNSITLAFVLGFLSHVVLDAVPHGDEEFETVEPYFAKIKNYVIIGLVDLIGVFSIIHVLLEKELIFMSAPLLAAVIGSMLPDLLWGAQTITKWKILAVLNGPLARLHRLIKYKISLPAGLIVQGAFLAFFVYLLTL